MFIYTNDKLSFFEKLYTMQYLDHQDFVLCNYLIINILLIWN